MLSSLASALSLFLICLPFVALAVVLLCVRIILLPGGRFVRTHVSQSAAMRREGVTCVQSQDRAMRRKSPHAVAEQSSK